MVSDNRQTPGVLLSKGSRSVGFVRMVVKGLGVKGVTSKLYNKKFATNEQLVEKTAARAKSSQFRFLILTLFNLNCLAEQLLSKNTFSRMREEKH